MQDRLSPQDVLLACFTLSSVAGLASLLRSGRRLTWRMLIATWLYSGVFGLVIGLVWYNWFDGQTQNHFFLIGVSGLAGLGGMSVLDFVVQVVGRGGLKVTIAPADTDGKYEDEDPPEDLG